MSGLQSSLHIATVWRHRMPTVSVGHSASAPSGMQFPDAAAHSLESVSTCRSWRAASSTLNLSATLPERGLERLSERENAGKGRGCDKQQPMAPPKLSVYSWPYRPVVFSAAAACTGDAQSEHFGTLRRPACEAAAALIRAMQPAHGTRQQGTPISWFCEHFVSVIFCCPACHCTHAVSTWFEPQHNMQCCETFVACFSHEAPVICASHPLPTLSHAIKSPVHESSC